MSDTQKEIDDLITSTQLEKLKLEVESLRSKNSWEHRVASYIPLITVLIAVGGFLLGVMGFQKQQRREQDVISREHQKNRESQERDRILGIKTQINEHTDQLLQFTNDQRQTIARVSFLLEDLKSLTKQPVSEAYEFSEDSETVTRSLIRLIHYDCDFIKKPRDVFFVTAVIEHWDSYSVYLRSDQKELEFILYKYIRALRELHRLNPNYFERLEYSKISNKYLVSSENPEEEDRFQHYGNIVIGFMKHLTLLQPHLSKKYIYDFKEALRNPALTEQLFADYPAYAGSIESASSTIILPQVTRIPGSVTEIVLKESDRSFNISVKLNGSSENHLSYRGSISNEAGTILNEIEGGRKSKDILTLKVNSILREGDYLLRVSSVDVDGRSEEAGVYYFRISNRK